MTESKVVTVVRLNLSFIRRYLLALWLGSRADFVLGENYKESCSAFGM
jgi:hypothetical protein